MWETIIIISVFCIITGIVMFTFWKQDDKSKFSGITFILIGILGLWISPTTKASKSKSNKHTISFTIEVKDINYSEKDLEDFIYYYLESEGHLDADNPFLEYGLLELNIDNIKITRK